jgi:hypothetical protein
MLQSMAKERIDFVLAIVVLIFLISSCTPDTSTQSEEEAMHLADYESPANKWGYMDATGQLVIRPGFDDAGPFVEGLAAVNLDGKWGYIDRKGKMVIPANYKSAWAFHERIARVKPFDLPDQYITTSGRIISSPEWAAADDFSNGLARVEVGNAFGYIDSTGKMILPAVYTRGWNFYHGLAVIAFDEKCGVINTRGEEVLRAGYDKIKHLEETNLLLCSTHDASFVFTTEGKELAKLENIKVVDSDGVLLSIRKGDRSYLFDIAEQKVLPGPGWDNLFYLGMHRWAGKTETGYFLLDPEGKKLSLKAYKQINRYSDGYAAYYNGLNWGYLDLNGVEITPDVFGLAWDYKNGYARAAFTEGIAFLNKQQQLAFYPPEGTVDMRDFSEGLAPVQIAR